MININLHDFAKINNNDTIGKAFAELKAIPSPLNGGHMHTNGFFLTASFSEICGGILLVGLCVAALIFGFRLIMRSALVRPIR
jgi:hypothetical protein